jgi:type IV secretory pathway VirB3-like protein
MDDAAFPAERTYRRLARKPLTFGVPKRLFLAEALVTGTCILLFHLWFCLPSALAVHLVSAIVTDREPDIAGIVTQVLSIGSDSEFDG